MGSPETPWLMASTESVANGRGLAGFRLLAKLTLSEVPLHHLSGPEPLVDAPMPDARLQSAYVELGLCAGEYDFPEEAVFPWRCQMISWRA